MALQLQTLKKQKETLANQLATQQRALQRANQLAEARRKVAAMQEEVTKLQQECAGTQASHEQPLPHSSAETFRQTEARNLRMDPFPEEQYIAPSAGSYEPNSPLSVALQHT